MFENFSLMLDATTIDSLRINVQSTCHRRLNVTKFKYYFVMFENFSLLLDATTTVDSLRINVYKKKKQKE